MTVTLNGAATETEGAATISELVRRLQLPPAAILVEHNGVALRPREWDGTSLAEGDRIEMIRVVAGG